MRISETSDHFPPVGGHGTAEWIFAGRSSRRLKHCEGWCGSGGVQCEAFVVRRCQIALWDKHGGVSDSLSPCGPPFQNARPCAPWSSAHDIASRLCRPLGAVPLFGLVSHQCPSKARAIIRSGKVLTARFWPSNIQTNTAYSFQSFMQTASYKL
jgi:hypothetical protein